MRKVSKGKSNANSYRGYKNFLLSTKRKLRKKRNRRSEYNFLQNVRLHAYQNGELFFFGQQRHTQKVKKNKPAIPNLSRFILSKQNSFSTGAPNWRNKGYLLLPDIFSLTQKPTQSYSILKDLICLLYYGQHEKIVIDYKNCNEIDLDASVCMDIIIMEYNTYLSKCNEKRFIPTVRKIVPLNYNRSEIKKVLFSIGAFNNTRGFKINFSDIICFNLRVRHKNIKYDSGLDITEMVDYVQDCLHKMHKVLSTDARKNLCDVIGEILINAEEHSTTQSYFSIGYFQEKVIDNKHIGIFNLVIFNFGDTIYEKFKSPDCQNVRTVKRMQELSEIYVKKNFFGKSNFTEENLWTLYALQEGVTSVPREKFKKRGNGSIRFIESFFGLKGIGTDMDDISKLIILSGNTKIIFDGLYEIVNKPKGDTVFKIMAFNEEGDIEEQPDKKYVTFVDNFFPGTLISAKILISDDDTKNEFS
jgi:hypothetical protein